MPRLILCADDFAFSPAVSGVIADLAADGRLNATSCMAVLPNWRADSAMLAGAPDTLAIGLHLVLTGETPLTKMSKLAPGGTLPAINPLGRMAARRALPLDEIALEIRAQFDAFEEAMGRAPDFVDGHQHSHALPGIREIVLAETLLRAPEAWLRTCEDRLGAMLSRPFRGKALASAFHSRGFRAAAAAHGLACNDSFAGHYGFAGDYAKVFPSFLRRPAGTHLVMCHPGSGSRDGDTIAAARLQEAAALATLPIADLAAAQGLTFPA
ncbi:hypothetical protein ASG11_18090 [Sphingomonas sp. Leaf357]|uniref:ChbG/HpnK family deacetylase n=1 Tax=Sphingomonas sp. Leaf357 TaxID=1736350 RepID=UPI0006FDC1F7|nr:ChbG/HpnK family deacetylase [Sphingomonas sp. Leaf357]KQS01560.1 hypothetical protein ASG11_18090 [Sphingomonas sp. Leaf357]